MNKHRPYPRKERERSLFAPPVIVLLACAIHSTAHAQGTVNFATRTPFVDAPVTVASWGFARADNRYLGQLYGSAPGGQLVPLGAPVAFRAGVNAGYIIGGGARIVPGVPPGSQAQIQMVAWEAKLGATYEAANKALAGSGTGVSAVILVSTGGSFSGPQLASDGVPKPSSDRLAFLPPGDLIGLPPFDVSFVLSPGTPQTFENSPASADNEFSCDAAVAGKSQVAFSCGIGEVTVSTLGTSLDAILESFADFYLPGVNSNRILCTDEPSGPLASLTFRSTSPKTYFITLARRLNSAVGATEVEYIFKEYVNSMTFSDLQAVYSGKAKAVQCPTVPSAPVRITYDGSEVDPVNAGDYKVVATVVDPRFAGSITSVLHIAQSPQVITFAPIPSVLATGELIALDPSSDSHLPVTTRLLDFVSGALDGNLLRTTHLGRIRIEFTQTGDGNYLAAEPKQWEINVINPEVRLGLVQTAPGSLLLTLRGQPMQTYRIQGTTTLPTTSWNTHLTVNSGASGNLDLVLGGLTRGERYFRAEWVPRP